MWELSQRFEFPFPIHKFCSWETYIVDAFYVFGENSLDKFLIL